LNEDDFGAVTGRRQGSAYAGQAAADRDKVSVKLVMSHWMKVRS
jgi:hypothetical protein